MKKILFKTFSLVILASFIASAEQAPKTEVEPEYAKTFKRLTWDQMYSLANKNLLSHRVFYAAPSTGPDAKWFDAVKKGDLKTIKSMLKKGQNIEAKDQASLGQTALGWAAFIGYPDVVEYLVSQGADLYATDVADVKSSLKSAILGGNIEIIEFLYPLVKDKVDLNEKDENDEETALMVAAWNNRIDAVKFLLAHGAKVDIVAMKEGTNAYDHNALTYACKQGNTEVIKLLIDAGAVNHKTNKPSCN